MLLSSVDEQSPEPMEALCGKEEGTEMAIRHVDMTQGAEGEGDSKHAKKKASSSNKAFKAAQKGKPLDEAAVFDAYADEGYLDLKALGKAVRATGRKCSPQQASALLAMYARAAPLRAAPRRVTPWRHCSSVSTRLSLFQERLQAWLTWMTHLP